MRHVELLLLVESSSLILLIYALHSVLGFGYVIDQEEPSQSFGGQPS
jgi:hypothetical protein